MSKPISGTQGGFVADDAHPIQIHVWFDPARGVSLESGRALLAEIDADLERHKLKHHLPGAVWALDRSVLLVASTNSAEKGLEIVRRHLQPKSLLTGSEIAISDCRDGNHYALDHRQPDFARHFEFTRNPQWRREHWDGTPRTPWEQFTHALVRTWFAIRAFVAALIRWATGKR